MTRTEDFCGGQGAKTDNSRSYLRIFATKYAKKKTGSQAEVCF